jgi:hypothetical protein
MKEFLNRYGVVIFLLAVLAYGGCTSNQIATAYKTETAVDTSVVAAWSLWTNYVQLVNLSTNSQVSVVAAFNKVKGAELIVIDASASLSATTNSASFSAAAQAAYTQAMSAMNQDLTDLGTALASFNIKLP